MHILYQTTLLSFIRANDDTGRIQRNTHIRAVPKSLTLSRNGAGNHTIVFPVQRPDAHKIIAEAILNQVHHFIQQLILS